MVDSGLCGGLGRRRPWLILAQTMMIVTALLFLRAGGDTAAILVVPARNPAIVRVLTANLDPELVEWDPGEGLEVVRVV